MSTSWLASPFYQAALVCTLLLLMSVVTRFRAMAVIQYGMYAVMGWIVASLVYSLFVDAFWYYLLYFVLSLVLVYFFWVATIYLTDKFGQPYLGDGWWGILVPVYIFLLMLAVTLLVYGVMALLRWIGN